MSQIVGPSYLEILVSLGERGEIGHVVDSTGGVEQTWPVIVFSACSWALPSKARLVAEIHAVDTGAAYSATLFIVAMETEREKSFCRRIAHCCSV